MPLRVNIEGRVVELPDDVAVYNTTEQDRRAGIQIRREYQFDRARGEVQIKTWEVKGMHHDWRVGPEDAVVPEETFYLVSDEMHPIETFLVAHVDDPRIERGMPKAFEIDKFPIGPARQFDHTLGLPVEELRNKKMAYEATFFQADKAYEALGNRENVLQKKGEEMPGPTTGSRVKVPDPRDESRWVFGTVVQREDDGGAFSTTLLCMDLPNSAYKSSPGLCGKHHGLVVDTRIIRTHKYLNSKTKFEKIPQHIGMFVHESFSFDGQKFPRNSVGRVLNISKDSGRATLRWFNVRGVTTFFVPTDYLRWCHFNPLRYSILSRWYTAEAPVAKGDILVYWGNKPQRVPACYEESYVMTQGVLLQLMGYDASSRIINATIISGMPPKMLGCEVQVREQDVRKFESDFVARGAKVEIVAEIMFKNKNLQGRRGKVVLPPDFEGDVGVEFPEDIGAGSLDGVGKEGQCLYIPVEAVRKT